MSFTSTTLQEILEGLNGLTAAEKMNIANLIFIESFKEKSIKETHPYFSGVRSGSKVPILENSDDFDGFPFTPGNCSLPVCTISSDFSEFTWQMEEIGCELQICLEDFTTDFKAFWNTWQKKNESDMETAIVQFIVERFQSRHLKAEIRVAYFGDTAATGDTLIEGMDGFFPQMQALADATNLVDVTENAAITVGGQTITSGEVVYNYLKAMYDKAAVLPWFDPSKMVWRFDRTLVNVLVGWLNTQADLKGISCDCIDPNSVTQARVFSADNLTIFGIPVEPMPFLAAMRASEHYFDPLTGLYTDKNRFILARKDNMLLGYETEETFNRFKLLYDERQDEIVVQGSSRFAPGVPTNSFILAI